ncbi:hypothetical protein A4X09_0g7264 [Tilletia walkeri]|uniref:Uncharacterized protein n=1 Tax=Tilletia walkeri TaxID=117179 RepID=A0A8X7N3G9_9BASI|nr:hypothetical protein A4X09_0g7264 [Tilletia walkeri]
MAHSDKWNGHEHADFIPISRISNVNLALSRTVARDVAATYNKSHHQFMEEMETVFEKTATAKNEWGRRIRVRTESGVSNSTIKEIVVLRVGSESDLSARMSWFTRVILCTNAPFVIQQDVSPPITDDQVMRLFPKSTPIPVKCTRKKGKTQNGADEIWRWNCVAKELTGVSDTVPWFDVRDFPKHGDLQDLSPAACELFRWAGPFPGVKDPTSPESTMAQTHRLCDLAEWCKEQTKGRDAKGKIYVAPGSGSEEENEAGAMNALLWVADYNEANAIGPDLVRTGCICLSTERQLLRSALPTGTWTLGRSGRNGGGGRERQCTGSSRLQLNAWRTVR